MKEQGEWVFSVEEGCANFWRPQQSMLYPVLGDKSGVNGDMPGWGWGREAGAA